MKKLLLLITLSTLTLSCSRSQTEDPLITIQIQDRNGLTETISSPDRLEKYEKLDFLSSQPYNKVLRFYRNEGKNRAKITSYHPNGMPWQYLEIEEMRAHGAYREWHPNGQKKIEAFVIGGTADISIGAQSDWQFDETNLVWNDKGELLAKISYKKGALEGSSLYYFPNGKIEKEVPYSNNSLNGNACEYFPDGKVKYKSSYHQGSKHGPSMGFFPSGELSFLEEYSKDLLLKGSYYSLSKELISEVDDGWGFQVSRIDETTQFIEIQRGIPEGIVKNYTPTQELLCTFHLKNRMKHGEEVNYFLQNEREDGGEGALKKLSVQWNQESIHGTVKTWYNNGQLQSQKEYCRNEISGPACAWYKDGSLMFIEEYEKGKVVKGFYYKLGQKEPISTIANGNGAATLFDEEGIFLRKVPYAKGKTVESED